jgi:hypothetical protein
MAGWIERAVDRTLEKRREGLTDELAELKGDVKALRREREGITEELALSDEVVGLRRSISKLEIEKSKKDEQHERKVRETEHRVGLLKLQQTHEVTNAKRETELQVREGNLSAERKRFEQEMEFQRKHLQGEVDRIESVLEKVLERLPNVDVAMRTAFSQNGRSRVGAGKGKD